MAIVIKEVEGDKSTSDLIKEDILESIPIVSNMLFVQMKRKGRTKKTVQTVIRAMVKDNIVRKKGHLNDMRRYTLVGNYHG